MQMKSGILWLPLLLILFLDLNDGRQFTEDHQGIKADCKNFFASKLNVFSTVYMKLDNQSKHIGSFIVPKSV